MKFFASLIALASLSGLSAALETTAVPPPGTYMQGITYGGTGCPQGSLDVNIGSKEKLAFSVKLTNMNAVHGPGVRVTDARKNCQVNFNINYPQGWTYRPTGITRRGNFNLGSGVSATVKTTYYFSGITEQTSAEWKISGPASGDFVQRDVLDKSVWAPCGQMQALNINSQIFVQGSSGTSGNVEVREEFLPTKGDETFGLEWARCEDI